jgi:hypothetical protein
VPGAENSIDAVNLEAAVKRLVASGRDEQLSCRGDIA